MENFLFKKNQLSNNYISGKWGGNPTSKWVREADTNLAINLAHSKARPLTISGSSKPAASPGGAKGLNPTSGAPTFRSVPARQAPRTSSCERQRWWRPRGPRAVSDLRKSLDSPAPGPSAEAAGKASGLYIKGGLSTFLEVAT